VLSHSGPKRITTMVCPTLLKTAAEQAPGLFGAVRLRALAPSELAKQKPEDLAAAIEACRWCEHTPICADHTLANSNAALPSDGCANRGFLARLLSNFASPKN
jgi:hypothetical protein